MSAIKEVAPLRIVLDVCEGDNGPSAVIGGAYDAYKEYGVDITLVGDQEVIYKIMDDIGCPRDAFIVKHASEVISMSEEPVNAVRHKRDASMIVALNIVKNGEADAMITAGSTGGLVLAGTLVARRIKGVMRPALATPIPTASGVSLLLDIGANVECTSGQLVQFAMVGSFYAEKVFGISKPRVALLSNGAEDYKGRAEIVEAHKILKESNIVNFIGNVEGRDIPLGGSDVVVSDGFTGNIALKTIEGSAKMMMKFLKEAMFASFSSKIGAFFLKKALMDLRKKTDYLEYGGAPLLGVESLLIKAHGSSDAKGIKGAIRVAMVAIENDTIQFLKEGMDSFPSIVV